MSFNILGYESEGVNLRTERKNTSLELMPPAQHASELIRNLCIVIFWIKFRSTLPRRSNSMNYLKTSSSHSSILSTSVILHPDELCMPWQLDTHHQEIARSLMVLLKVCSGVSIQGLNYWIYGWWFLFILFLVLRPGLLIVYIFQTWC